MKKIFIMTDMEGCAGILNHDDWVMPEGRWYEKGMKILTEEVNAVIDGLIAGGAAEFLVADGHGAGGIDPLLLHPRALLLRGNVPYPFHMDSSFDGIAFVGGHAKAGTPFSHITHTERFDRIDISVNGLSVGEYGEMALFGLELGVPCIFAGGEEAFAREAEALTPGVVGVGVKRGLKEDGLDHLTTGEYRAAKLDAIHCSHFEACRRLREGAALAVRKLLDSPASFRHPAVNPPYRLEVRYRAEKKGEPQRTACHTHESSLIKLFNSQW